jgi:hypothetical protein
MMINRVELIEKIKAKIKEREERSVANLERAKFDARQAQDEYVQQTSEAWSKFATTVRRRVRQGQPITAVDVPEALTTRGGWEGKSLALFKRSVIKERDYAPQIEGFRSLLLVLESSPDELISTSALERLGAPVRELFR